MNNALSVIVGFQTEFEWTDDTALLHLAEFIDHCELGDRLMEYLTYIAKEQTEQEKANGQDNS